HVSRGGRASRGVSDQKCGRIRNGTILSIRCVNILFPSVRESVSDAVTRREFPTVMLNPVNFEALYQQQRQKAQAESGGMTIY
ncbi:MAG: protein-export chaperone SecB, partial [Nitrospira sp.]|nr:protein-export chaperone SecB [Nitrospira sp.]